MNSDSIREEARRRYRENGGAALAPLDSVEAVEELRIHQIELEIQNEELRRAEKELREAHERYFALFELAPIGYVTADPDGHILSANLTICELAGIERRALEWGGLFQLVDDADRPAMLRLLRHAAATENERMAVEVRLAHGDRPVVHVEAVRHDGEAVTGEIQLSFTDVTREKQAEARAQEAADHNALLLRELNHRVKNNLQLLLSIVKLQRNRSPDSSVESALASMEDRVRTIVSSNELLSPGSTKGGADLVELLSTIGRHFDERQDASVRFVASVDRLVVDGDTALSIALVANELVANAMKYGLASGDRNITVRLEADAETSGSRRAQLVVADSGPGLPPELLSPPRGLGSRGGDDSFSGRGLGFQLVSQLAEQQLGGTWIRRNRSEGGAEHVISFDV